jgi:hypothetical protein
MIGIMHGQRPGGGPMPQAGQAQGAPADPAVAAPAGAPVGEQVPAPAPAEYPGLIAQGMSMGIRPAGQPAPPKRVDPAELARAAAALPPGAGAPLTSSPRHGVTTAEVKGFKDKTRDLLPGAVSTAINAMNSMTQEQKKKMEPVIEKAQKGDPASVREINAYYQKAMAVKASAAPKQTPGQVALQGFPGMSALIQ